MLDNLFLQVKKPWRRGDFPIVSDIVILEKAIQQLRGIRKESPLVTTAALEKRENHLTFMSGELAVFSLFDLQLTHKERQEIATKLFTLLWSSGS